MLAHGPSTKDKSPIEHLGNLILLIVGGNDTTRNSMSGSVYALNKWPEQYDKLIADPSLISNLVPEIIRWQTPLAYMRRTATKDVEFRGKQIKKDDQVLLWYLSANRDEAVFGDNADVVDLERPNADRHLAFGHGIHYCMGARIAELQLRILWEEILPRSNASKSKPSPSAHCRPSSRATPTCRCRSGGSDLMQTPMTDMFGIDVPIFAFTHCRDVVAAVTKAGGLGVLGAVAHSPEQLEIDLEWIKNEIGDRPFGVDLIVPAKYAGSDEGGLNIGQVRELIPAEHKAYVDDILERYGVPALADDEGGRGIGRGGSDTAAPMSAESQDPNLEIALAHGSSWIVNALGPPPQHMIDRCNELGVKTGALAGKAQHAERHVNAGVDFIIAQGSEAGGHTGEIGTMVLIPEIVDAVGDTPVLGAGGIGHGRQMAAAMALALLACGAVRCGSPPTRPKPTRSSRTSSSPPPRRTRSVPAVERESTPVSSSPRGPTSGRTPRLLCPSACRCRWCSPVRRSCGSIGRPTTPAPVPKRSRTTSWARSSAR